MSNTSILNLQYCPLQLVMPQNMAPIVPTIAHVRQLTPRRALQRMVPAHANQAGRALLALMTWMSVQRNHLQPPQPMLSVKTPMDHLCLIVMLDMSRRQMGRVQVSYPWGSHRPNINNNVIVMFTALLFNNAQYPTHVECYIFFVNSIT